MILIDHSEPDNIRLRINQSVHCVTAPLNNASIADYQFAAVDHRTHQVERKQALELLSNLDNCERELRKYYGTCDRTSLLCEGIISPFRLSGAYKSKDISIRKNTAYALYAYSVSDSGRLDGEYKVAGIGHSEFRAWLLQLDMLGVSFIQTTNWIDTADTIVAMWKNLQKAEHHTLNRYFRPKSTLKDQNPHIQALMNLSAAYHLDIGEARATALIQRFGTLWGVILAEPYDVDKVKGCAGAYSKLIYNLQKEVHQSGSQ